jgi:hypothetical protein
MFGIGYIVPQGLEFVKRNQLRFSGLFTPDGHITPNGHISREAHIARR